MNPIRQCRKSLAAIAIVLMAAGAGLAARPAAHEIIRQVSAARAKTIWQKWKRSYVESPAEKSTKAGEPVFWLRVASCKISTLVLQESDTEALHRFPAVRRLESGGCIALAHRDLHFRALAHIHGGDEISVESADGNLATYSVRSLRILLPEEVATVLKDSDNADSLHLLTCYPFQYIGAAPKRFLVTATRRR